MTRRELLCAATALPAARAAGTAILDAERFRHYVDAFNQRDSEEVVNHIPNAQAWEWMKRNIPFFTCPDAEIEQIYYFRWWSYRKHIKQTPEGFLVTEFLKPVGHAGDYNSLSCAFAHHVAEGRWLHDTQYIDGCVRFWLNDGARKNFHQFSNWAAAVLYDRRLADSRSPAAYLDALLADHQQWERERLTDSGLFWQRDVSDGMEESISGGRRVRNIRPSINSYLYGNAKAIAAIARMADRPQIAHEFDAKSARLKSLVQERLWNRDAAFFETRLESGEFAAVRELIGYTPWYFELPDSGAGYEAAWKQLMDPAGFYAPFGPTTAERRHPQFTIAYEGDDCQWNGPSWPFATTITLRALANLLNGPPQNAIGRDAWFRTFQIYTASQHRKLEDGRVIPWIDEDLNPLTGEWLARARKAAEKGFYERGQYYNHSAYADPLICGLVGLRPRADGVVEVNPLAPAKWDWFCLDHVPYHGRALAVVWDRTGAKFGKGSGLQVFVDGRRVSRSPRLDRVQGKLP
jgi:hypothetical protein